MAESRWTVSWRLLRVPMPEDKAKKCLREGAQAVTKHGAEAAVLMPGTEWQQPQRSGEPTLKALLLADDARDFDIPQRGRRCRR